MLSAGGAGAITCHLMFDRSDQLIYQDITPPVDLSDNGASARAALRNRGDYLMVIDTERCPRISSVAAGGTSVASVDDIVGGMRPYMGLSAGGPSARQYARSTSASPAASPAASAPAAATGSRSSSTRMY